MKTPLALLAFALAGLGLSGADNFPPHMVANSLVRDLPVNAAGRHYQLHIGLPESYGKETGKRYPVVYVTDGYWDFEKMMTIRGCLVYDKVAPEFIVVGIGYAGDHLDYGNLRRWELTPVQSGGGGPDASGHAADYLKTIETEIIPLVEKEYRADSSYRVLSGASLGGLFTLYSMYTRPGLFQAYIAATPWVTLENEWLLGYEQDCAKAGHPLKGRLFISVGENEWPMHVAGVKRFNDRIVSRQYKDLAYQFRIIDGERHAGMQLESYVRGLRFAFAPLAPESGQLK